MLESKFQKRYLDQLKKAGYKTQKFTDEFCLGIPDTLASKNGAAFWAELKTAKIPKRPDTPLKWKWRGGQVNWLKRWWMEPSYTCMILGTDAGWLLLRPQEFEFKVYYHDLIPLKKLTAHNIVTELLKPIRREHSNAIAGISGPIATVEGREDPTKRAGGML